MDLLTLSRYILESSLLHSQFSSESDSLVASAALWLASCMSKRANEKAEQTAMWTTGLQHYTGWLIIQNDWKKIMNFFIFFVLLCFCLQGVFSNDILNVSSATFNYHSLHNAVYLISSIFFSGYKVEDIHDTAVRLNAWLKCLPAEHLTTIHSKYSHKVFRKVALISPLEKLWMSPNQSTFFRYFDVRWDADLALNILPSCTER